MVILLHVFILECHILISLPAISLFVFKAFYEGVIS